MVKSLLSTATFIMTLLWLNCATDATAADRFVSFSPVNDAWQLQDITLGYATTEHSCVQRAAANLVSDLEKVTGIRPSISDSPKILIGTVGTNKQIDAWVKQGLLPDLKGKTEKYIIKTIGDQLVIAGSDKRGTVYGIYELSRQIGVSPW